MNIAGGAADLATTDANVSINANTADLTVGYADIGALQDAVDNAAITEVGSAAFATGDELVIVWYNTTDEAYEIGIITIVGNAFDGDDETYEKLMSVNKVGTLTQAGCRSDRLCCITTRGKSKRPSNEGLFLLTEWSVLSQKKGSSDWTSGYVADVDYTYGYYPELNPLRTRQLFSTLGYCHLKSNGL